MYFDIDTPSEYLFSVEYAGGTAYAVENGEDTYDLYLNGAGAIESDLSGFCNCSCVIFGSNTYVFGGGSYFSGLGSAVEGILVDFTDASLVFESDADLFSGSSVSEIYLPCALSSASSILLDKEYHGFSDSGEETGVYSVFCDAGSRSIFFSLQGQESIAVPTDSVLIWTDDNGVEYYDTDALSVTDISYNQDKGILAYLFDVDADGTGETYIVTSTDENNLFKNTNKYIFLPWCNSSDVTTIIFRDKMLANTSTSSMFYSCKSLVKLDLSLLNMNKVTNASYMFYYCTSLTTIIGIDSFYSTDTCDTSYMFYYCKSLTEIDLKNFKKLGNYCFDHCNNLFLLKNMDNITSIGNKCFQASIGANCLITLTDIHNTTNEVVLNYNWQSDNRIIDSLIYTDASEKKYYASQAEKIIGFAQFPYECRIIGYIFNIDNNPLEQIFVMCSTSENNICTQSFYDNSPQHMYLNSSTSIKKIVIKDKMKLSDATSFFYNMKQVNEFVGLENFDISDVTSLQNMFYNCQSVEQLDLSTWDANNVTTMNSMFNGCKMLSSLILPFSDTSNNININTMFYKCSSLKSLDLSSLDLSNVTNSTNAFSNCTSLEFLNLGNISEIGSYFAQYCTSLTSITGLDNVTSIGSSAFYRVPTTETPLLYTDINGCKNEVVLNYNWEGDNRTIACDSFTIALPAKIEAPVVVPSEGASYYGTEVEGRVSYKLGSGKKLCVDAVDSFSLVNEKQEKLTASVTQSDSEFSSDTGTLNSDGDYEDSFTIAIKITGDKLDYNTVYSGEMGFTVSIKDG